MLFLLIPIFSILSGASAFADEPVCKKVFATAVESVAHDLEALPPLSLDLPSVQGAVHRLFQDIRSLKPHFQALRSLETLMADGVASPAEVEQQLQIYREKLASEAEEHLFLNQGTLHERKVLEGYRILLNRAQLYQRRAHAYKKQQEAAQEAAQEAVEEADRNTQSSVEDQSSDSDESQSKAHAEDFEEGSDEDQSQRSEEELSDPTDPKAKLPEEEVNTSPSPGKSKKDSSRSKKTGESNRSKRPEPQQKVPQKDKASSEKKEGKPSEGDEKSSQEKGESPSEDEGPSDEDQSEGDGQSEGKGRSEGEEQSEGDGQSETKAQGTGSSQKKGDKDSQPKGPKQKQGGAQSKSSLQKESATERSKSGNGAGKGGDPHIDLAKSLADYMHKMAGIKKTESDESDRELEHDDTHNDQEMRERTKQFQERMRESMSATEKKMEELRKRFEGKENPSQEARRRPPLLPSGRVPAQSVKGSLRSLSQNETTEFLKHFLEDLYRRVLRSYRTHESLISELGQYQNLCVTLQAIYPLATFVPQLGAMANQFRERLEINQIDYKNLEELGLSFISGFGQSDQGLLRKLEFLDALFTEIARVDSLTFDEQKTHHEVQVLLKGLKQQQSLPSDRDLGQAFSAQLVGPLSRRAISNRFASADPREDLDWSQLAEAIRQGQISDLLTMSRTKPYLNVFLNTSMIPKHYQVPLGAKIPINESEPQLEGASELSRFPYFQRDGAPLEAELLRYVSGDSLENVYREDITRHDPKKPKPKKVSIVLLDVTGSMMDSRKNILSHTLAAAFLDQSQREVVLNEAEHVVYFVPFTTYAHDPDIVRNLQEAQALFDRFRAVPAATGSNTSITQAMVDVFKLIEKHEKEGGELSRANILLITDGVDTLNLNAIQTARDQIASHVDVVVNAVSLLKDNQDVAKMIEKLKGEKEGQVTKASYQYISIERLNELLDSATALQMVQAAAPRFNTEAATHVDNQQLLHLSHSLSSLDSHLVLNENRGRGVLEATLKGLEALGLDHEPEALSPLWKVLSHSWALTERWSPLRKAASFQHFLELAGQSQKVDGGTIFGSLAEAQRQSLRQWLGDAR